MSEYAVQVVEMVKDGKRNVKVANAVRAQAFDKVIAILNDAGFAAAKAANGDIYFPLVEDASTGDIYNLRLAVSLSSKGVDTKVVRKAKEKVVEEEEIPTLFDAE